MRKQGSQKKIKEDEEGKKFKWVVKSYWFNP